MTESVKLTVSDLTKIVGTSTPLTATLFDLYGNPLQGKQVKFNINGVDYTRTVEENGSVSLNINLSVGVYPCTVTFEGDSSYSGATENVTVTVTSKKLVVLSVSDFVKTWGEQKALKASLYESDATPIPGKELLFTINGVQYKRTTDNNGTASLNINLPKGNYRCVVDSPEDNTHQSYQANCNVKVKANTFMDGTNITKMEDETVVYQCAVYDNWSRIHANVVITVNGVSYNKTTGDDGLAKLNIKLPAGEYTLTARFDGDDLNNPSSVTNYITSKKYAQELTTVRNGVATPAGNIGFMESRIYCVYWDAEKSKKQNRKVITPEWGEIINEHGENARVQFTSYEITETDPRVKTAKFTSPLYIDLTLGRQWVYITSPYHENFGGQVLKVDYDKSTGLYTYQCQDGRRQYLSKNGTKSTKNTCYEILEGLLISPNMAGDYSFPIKDAQRKNPMNQRLLSGLHPIEDYDNLKDPVMKFSNMFRASPGEILSFDSVMDKIMNLSHMGQFPTDVYFTPDGICHIDPIDLNTWLKTGFRLTHSDLVQYKYGFDTTNVVTAVLAKESGGGGKWYSDAGAIAWYFGAFWDVIDASTTTSTSTGTSDSSTSTSSSSSGGSNFLDMGQKHHFVVAIDSNSAADSSKATKLCNALRNKGHTVEYLGIGPNQWQSRGGTSWAKGKIVIFSAVNDGGVFYDMAQSYYNYEKCIYLIDCTFSTEEVGLANCKGLRQLKNYVDPRQGYNRVVYNSGIESMTAYEWCKKHPKVAYVCGNRGDSYDTLINNLLAGKFNGEGGSTSSTSTVDTGTSQQTTTVMDEVATYQKALEKMSDSVRRLLSFEIKLPLNHTMFKNLHTNQMLWTELPREFKLANLEKIFKILPSYKVNRGVAYQENRWYIEKNVIKCDSNGLFATLTLNPFPSSYSVYSNAVKGYVEAYNQAFKQQTASATNTSTTSTTSTDGVSNKYGTKIQNLVSGWIAGKTTDLDKAKAIHYGLRDYGIIYQKYYNFDKTGGKAETALNKAHQGLNCGDTAVLTAACMLAAGLNAYIVLRCDSAHYFTVINIGGTKYYSDLTWSEGAYSKREWNVTWENNKCGNKYNVNIH